MVLKMKFSPPHARNARCWRSLSKTAIQEMDIEADVKNIHDAIYIREKGVTRVPALLINNKLIIEGRVPTVTEMKGIVRTTLSMTTY